MEEIQKIWCYTAGVTLWLIGVPLAFITAFIFKLPVYIVALMTAIEETIKVVILIKRFISISGINNVIENIKDKNMKISLLVKIELFALSVKKL